MTKSLNLPARPILLNGLFLARPVTGVRLVGREMIRALLTCVAGEPGLAPRGVVLAAPNAAVELSLPGIDLNAPPSWLTVLRGSPSRLSEQLWLAWEGRARRTLHFCNSFSLLGGDQVVWMHDAHTLDAPESYSRAYQTWARVHFEIAKRGPTRVVTISEYSKSRLLHHGLAGEKISVIWNGGDHLRAIGPDASVLAEHDLADRPFCLLIGSRAKHKNIDFAVSALLAHGPTDITLAVVGLSQTGPYAGEVRPHQTDRVVILPHLSDAALRALYQAARMVMIPSKQEGFGLPVVEAMWEGAPVCLANKTALPEIGADAAIYFDPDDARAIGKAALRMNAPAENAAMRQASLARAPNFTWQRAAQAAIAKFF